MIDDENLKRKILRIRNIKKLCHNNLFLYYFIIIII